MPSTSFVKLLAIVPFVFAAAPIEFAVDYEVWGFEPVGCVGAPEQSGTFSTRECTNLEAYFGKFTIEAPAESCTLHYWNATGCQGAEGLPYTFPSAEETDCLGLVIVPSPLSPTDPALGTAQSIQVLCE